MHAQIAVGHALTQEAQRYRVLSRKLSNMDKESSTVKLLP